MKKYVLCLSIMCISLSFVLILTNLAWALRGIRIPPRSCQMRQLLPKECKVKNEESPLKTENKIDQFDKIIHHDDEKSGALQQSCKLPMKAKKNAGSTWNMTFPIPSWFLLLSSAALLYLQYRLF